MLSVIWEIVVLFTHLLITFSSLNLLLLDLTISRIFLFIYFFLQTQPSPHPVREDCVRSPRWPPQPGDRSRPHLPAPASWPRGHAGCYCSDGDAPVHQQRAAKSGCAFHHPLRSLDWGSGWRTRGFSQSKGKPCPFPHCGDFFSLKYNLKLSCRRDSLHRTWITRFTTSCPVLGQNMALASGNLALELSIRYFFTKRANRASVRLWQLWLLGYNNAFRVLTDHPRELCLSRSNAYWHRFPHTKRWWAW